MPTEPTTLFSGGALRSGRNTSRWHSRPMKAAIAMAMMNASTPFTGFCATWRVTGRFKVSVGRMSNQGSLMSPVSRSSDQVYAVYIAMAPCAKLMTPEPLNPTTRPDAKMAYRPPAPSPTIKAKTNCCTVAP